MQIFHPKILAERIGPDLKKSKSLRVLEKAEQYLIDRIKNHYNWEIAYDVMANEVPHFKTMGYTEYAGNMMFQPLTLSLRDDQIIEAYYDDESEILDYASELRNRFTNKKVNKYEDRENWFDKFKPKKNIVVLPGSNKIKSHACMNKMKKIKKDHGNDVYFKPHPITTFQIIGELKDFFGEKCILPRNADMYAYMQEANKVYTTHMSESVAYGVALGKEVEPFDVHNRVHESSYYSINRILFRKQKEGDRVINKIFSSHRSGIINLDIDPNWKIKIDKYLDYANEYRNTGKNWYIIKENNKSN